MARPEPRQFLPWNPLTGALGFLGARNHLVPAPGLPRLIFEHVIIERLEASPVPLHVIATDVLTGEEVRLSEGAGGGGRDGERRDPWRFPGG